MPIAVGDVRCFATALAHLSKFICALVCGAEYLSRLVSLHCNLLFYLDCLCSFDKAAKHF